MTSTHIPGKGVFLDAEVCAYYFRLAVTELGARRLEGARLAPALRSAQDALRSAVQERSMPAMSADGHVSRTSADMPTELISEGFLSTDAMADRLGVGVRHARRLASEAGIEPAARDAWHSCDIDRLVAIRRTA